MVKKSSLHGLTRQPSLTPRAPSLASLPREIINHISTHLDKSSFLRLIRVSRAFAYLSNDHRLWASLALYLPLHYGERPCIPPTAPKGKNSLWGGRQRAETKAEYSLALKALISTVICRADETRWAKVRAVDLEPMPSAWTGLAQVLNSASASLLTLHVRGELDPYLYDTHDRFDYKLLEEHITSPSLTHLHIGSNANVSPAILSVVCNGSPGLRSLNVSLTRPTKRGGIDDAVHTASRYRNPTAVRVARIEMTGCNYAEDDEVIDALVEFLAASPSLRQLSLPHDGIEYQSSRTVIAALAEMPCLEDLHWPVDLFRWQDVAGSGIMGDTKIRRLVLACVEHEEWVDLFQDSVRIPSLEKLYIDASSLESRSPKIGSQSPPLEAMTPIFAESLRDQPKLHIIHTLLEPIDTSDLDLFKRLDIIENRSEQLGYLASVKQDSDELLHARVALHIVEASDEGGEGVPDPEGIFLRYDSRESDERIKIYDSVPHAVWQDLTYFMGLAVPLNILEKMRRLAGISEADWRQRGVTVNSTAWAYLKHWHTCTWMELERRMREEAESEEDDEQDCNNEECWAEECYRGNLCYGRTYHYRDGCQE